MMLSRKYISLFQSLKLSKLSLSNLSNSSIDFKAFPYHKSLVIEEYGDPEKVVQLKVRTPEEILPQELDSDQIIATNILSTINPADINLIQGVYGKKPKLPSIIGGEGLVRVNSVGTNVKHLKPGDLAIGVKSIGYWQSYCIRDANEYFKVDSELRPETAAQLKVNPCTAYRMISDFADLVDGDVIIQNGANSAVGVYAVQLAKHWGYKTINVIRDRPGKDHLISELKAFGADYVVTETELSNQDIMKPILEKIGKPKLLLNCVGGKNAINCQRLLKEGGFSITYGAMSKQPFSVTASSLIFKDHKYVGFWVSRWYDNKLKDNDRVAIERMLGEIQNLFKSGILKPKATTLLTFEERDTAFTQSNNTKYMFSLNES